MIGKTLSHYTIESRLGGGGMGEVFLGRDTRLGRPVAIKILPLDAARREESVRRFLLEARSASSLNHPNIVTIYDIDQQDDLRFIVMEVVDGTALSAIAGKPMPLDRFLEVALQTTAALAAAHEAGIIHRDIKPGNVMLSNSGRIKVVDFGLARLTAAPSSQSADSPTEKWETPETAPGVILGTVGYMSPEQVQGRPVDARSDVFSLGVLFYELLSGRRAFGDRSPMETIAAILRDEPAPLERTGDNRPPRLLRAITRCLAKEPGRRFASAVELHAELEAIRDERANVKPRRALITAAVVAALLLGTVAFVWWRRESRQRWVRNTALPEIERMISAQEHDPAWRLARRAMAIAPDDPQLKQHWANLVAPTSITSEPPGAEVAVRGYRDQNVEWISLGRTPIPPTELPITLLRFRVTLDGYVPLEVAPPPDFQVSFRLHRAVEMPPGMVHVAGGPAQFENERATLPDFWIDRHEVTNRQYRQFLSAGGYRRKEWWKHPIVKNGRTLAWEEAMRELVDSTGRPGPAQWELGTYPAGTDQHPVEGISWYEAAAYAESVGKSLPTVFHWMHAQGELAFSDMLTMSNYSSDRTVPVGSLGGVGAYGTEDMAGNVKEWCLNPAGSQHYILGGSWSDPAYTYLEPEARAPIERARGFGIRLVRQSPPLTAELLRAVQPQTRDFPPPVDDATFRTYASLFNYDPAPLNAKVESIDDSHRAWRREKVSFDAAYPGERVPAHLFLPKNAKPPYQTILFFPGSDAVLFRSSKQLWLPWVEFFIHSGRAVVYPIYKGTYERTGPEPAGPHARRDLRIQRIKDVRRTLDYLATRQDLDSRKIAYHGVSLGASYAPYALAMEPRFKAATLLAGGMWRSDLPAEVQPQNYLPRVTIPVLLVNGEHDFTRPVETSQRPYFDLLGTPAANKRHAIVAGGHLPADYAGTVREMLAWTDRWLGPVETH